MPEPSSPSTSDRRFDSPEQEAWLNLWRTYEALRADEDALFAAHDLTPQQYNALRLLRAATPDGLPTLQLQSRLVSRAPDITRMLDRLEERGLVARSRDESNRRVVQVRLTEAGATLLDQLRGPVRECGKRQFGHLSADRLRTLIELLQTARRPHEDPGSAWADL